MLRVEEDRPYYHITVLGIGERILSSVQGEKFPQKTAFCGNLTRENPNY